MQEFRDGCEPWQNERAGTGTDEVQKLGELGQAECSRTWRRYWPFSLGQWNFTEGFLSRKVTQSASKKKMLCGKLGEGKLGNSETNHMSHDGSFDPYGFDGDKEGGSYEIYLKYSQINLLLGYVEENGNTRGQRWFSVCQCVSKQGDDGASYRPTGGRQSDLDSGRGFQSFVFLC